MAIALAGSAAGDSFSGAVAALNGGDLDGAAKILRVYLQSHPNAADALGLLGVVLDRQKMYREAGEAYGRALALAPNSASLLNNYGNHLLATGDAPGALTAYLKVVTMNPAHPNANLQLARIELSKKAGAEALRYLSRLPAEDQKAPEVVLLRIEALFLTGKDEEARSMLESLSTGRTDAAFAFSAGLALAGAGQYEKAETFFSRALEAAPADFDVLYNLGLAAAHAGHYERAHNALTATLEQRPQDVDSLYNLAVADAGLKRYDAALRWLAQAARLAPERPNIQLLLAHTASEVGAHMDALEAWNRYLKLVPGDDEARRERGFLEAGLGRHADGIAELGWYVRKHPDDPLGHYQLGVAEGITDPDRALPHLEKALALQPDLVAARFDRGALNYQAGKPEAALADLEYAVAREPGNAIFLDRLGEDYLALGRAADAVRMLHKAAEIAPKDYRTLLDLSRALRDAGETEEAKAVLDRFRQLGPNRHKEMPAGLVDFLSLPPERQYEQYRARVEQAVLSNPGNAQARLQYLGLLLDDGDTQKAAAVAREIVALKPGAEIVAAAGRTLLDSEQYALAKELLDQAAGAGAPSSVRLDIAIATSHSVSAQAGLDEMDRVPAAERGGDYYLARAQMLDALGRIDDAVSALNQALRAAPKRPDLYRQATLFLIKQDHIDAALNLLAEGVRLLPNDPGILLTQATALELGTHAPEAELVLKKIERRWPEWSGAWAVHGVLLETHNRSAEARQALETALALGARTAETYYYLAESILESAPDRIEDAKKAIGQAVELAPGDPWVRTLAGRVAYEQKDYAAALDQLREAVKIRPQLTQAHYFLSRVYTALGRKPESEAELAEVTLIRKQFPHADEQAPEVLDNLFLVKAPPVR